MKVRVTYGKLQAESQIISINELDFFSNKVPLRSHSTGSVSKVWARFVWDGEIMNGQDRGGGSARIRKLSGFPQETNYSDESGAQGV